MKIKLIDTKKLIFSKEKFLIFPFFTGEKITIGNKEIEKEIKKLSLSPSSLKENEIRLLISEKHKFIFLNVGEKEKWNQRKFILNLRKIVRYLLANRFEEVIILLDKIIPEGAELDNLVRQLPENILIANYEFNSHKEKPKEGWFKIKSIETSWLNYEKYQKDLKQGEIIGNAVNFARDLANMPGGEITPAGLAKEAVILARKNKNIKVEVFDENKIKKLKMGGILGVSKGSCEKPKLIILKYFGNQKSKKTDLVYVGKGITFDSGGLQTKPSDHMTDMHLDMSGGAAVLGAMEAVSKIKIPLNIIGIIPAVENMPSGQAFRPGDILKTYNRKTIEVGSTDAEGRIILADALAYGAKIFQPKMIIDVATLTGAVVKALGQRAIGLFTNLPNLESDFRKIGEDSGDFVWPFPCWEEYEEEIQGTFGDLTNTGKTHYGGAITAALFLKNFIENKPWVHLDIASTMTSIENQGLAKGATGTGVRYLVKLAKEFSNLKLA